MKSRAGMERGMLDWIDLPNVLAYVTLVILLYMLITYSAGIYATARQFWRMLLLSTGISYLLSGSLFLFFGITPLAAVGTSAIVPFLMGSLDFGEQEAPTQAAESQPKREETKAESSEDEAMEEEAQGGQDEGVYEVLYQNRRDSEQYN
jgi:hypothetical protein